MSSPDTDIIIAVERGRMQTRIDACLARNQDDVTKAAAGKGIAISYGFAQDIVRAFDHAVLEIAWLRQAVRR